MMLKTLLLTFVLVIGSAFGQGKKEAAKAKAETKAAEVKNEAKSEAKSEGKKAAKKGEDVPDNLRCTATTQAGTRCKRKADDGSKFCWQHSGAKKKGETKKKAA